jgi:hypothetical protein
MAFEKKWLGDDKNTRRTIPQPREMLNEGKVKIWTGPLSMPTHMALRSIGMKPTALLRNNVF